MSETPEEQREPERFVDQKFIGLLIILLGTFAVLAFGFVGDGVFQTTVLWAFAIFAGAEVGGVGVQAFQNFAIAREKLVHDSQQGRDSQK